MKPNDIKKTIFGNEPKKSIQAYQEEVRREINSRKVEHCHHSPMSSTERAELKEAKKQFAKDKKRHFFAEQRDSLIRAFVNAKTPNWSISTKFIFA